jgi:soluble cytochrome b562
MNQIFGDATMTVPRCFDEKAYRRQSLAEWDSRWHRLSRTARYYFFQYVKGTGGSVAPESAAAGLPVTLFQPGIAQELSDAGFVDVQSGKSKGQPDRVVASPEIDEFATRAHIVRRYHLLSTDQPGDLAGYVTHAYFVEQFTEVLGGVLRAAGIDGLSRLGDLLDRYVIDHHWPERVAASLNEPLAKQILDVVQIAKGPIPLAELPALIPGSDPDEVRMVADKLVARLALVEDMQPWAWELMVGMFPAVREKLAVANLPRERPPLVKCERPMEVGPDRSAVVNDMRAVLLEVASQPPRLRQDQTLFHKEIKRFQAALDPLAGWLLDAMKWSEEGRLKRAVAWARTLQLAKDEPEGKELRFRLTPEGHEWLAAGAAEAPLEIYHLLSSFDVPGGIYSPYLDLFAPEMYPWDTLGPADVRFLGSHVLALKGERGKRPPSSHAVKPVDYLALRKQLDTALAELKPGVLYRLDSVESHLVFREHNPLNLGLPAEQVAVFSVNRPVPTARPQREELGRQVIRAFVLQRLIPFGCMQAAIDDEGRICVARGPRYDAYFGRKVDPTAAAASADVEATATKVVVQPDFSVMVIGANPAPAAALAPFCERTNRGSGQGAIVLKITRESVVKAVKNGLKSPEIVARLKHHASNELPANVLRQVQEWSTWVRRVTVSSLIALQCPDSDTADRVMAVMKRQAQRVNSTVVAVDLRTLTTVERNKLEEHGILVDGEPESQVTRSKAGKKH